jgi:RNA polymerase sigma-70 factor (ECF subfamily)
MLTRIWAGTGSSNAVAALGSPGRPEWAVTVVQNEPAPGRADLLKDLDERELVRVCLEGQREAFDVIIERHRRPVYQLCYRFVSNHEDASDLSQDVFLRAYRGLKGFKGQSSLGTWLYRIGVNVCLNRVGVKVPQTEPLDARPHQATGHDPAGELLRNERTGRVRAAIARLPRKQRATLILRIYQELSHQEIAEILGSSVGAVKANFFHALGNLKRMLEGDPV